MLDAEYFKVDRFSNSFLSLLKSKLNGTFIEKDLEDKKEYLMFGKQFEDLLQFDIPSDNKVIQNMVRVTKENKVYQSLMNHKDVKVQHIVTGKFYDLPFKMKADIYIRNLAVPDLKTTSCKSLISFERSVDMFDYDRQMYVYMTLAKVPKAPLVGVSKENSPQVFIVPVEKGDRLWRQGKQKTEYLINVLKTLRAA